MIIHYAIYSIMAGLFLATVYAVAMPIDRDMPAEQQQAIDIAEKTTGPQ